MRALAITVLLGAMAAGCGGSGPGLIPITTARVAGRATYKDRPLEGYRVYFYCGDTAANEPATGMVNADGSFVLSVRDQDDGAIVGRNSVWLKYEPEITGEVTPLQLAKLPPPKVALPQKFTAAATSGLTVEVPSGGLADYRLDLR